MKSRIAVVDQGASGQPAPWHILNFLPEPHGHGALRGVLAHSSLTTVSCLAAGRAVCRAAWRARAGAWGIAVGDAVGASTSAGASPLATALAAAVRNPDVSCVSDDVVWRFCRPLGNVSAGATAAGAGAAAAAAAGCWSLL